MKSPDGILRLYPEQWPYNQAVYARTRRPAQLFTVIAIPNGVTDTYAFLEEQGWIEQADQYGELLFVLEPANGTWGSVEAERDYLNICIGETVGNTAFDTRSTSNSLLQSGTVSLSDGTSCPVFTGHSCNYYVGYDEGCAVLESWTSNNPMYVAARL